MSEDALDQWERDYRSAARADNCAILREHLRRLGLPDEPESMLEGTIATVRACAGYALVDDRGEEFDPFLAMQKYKMSEASDARYVFTFDIWGKGYSRILVENKVGTLDLADLNGNPWWDYEVVGFHHLWISHPDWSNLADEELRQLEQEVTDDLRFDYSEDELDFWFDGSSDEAYLFITLQDVPDSEDELDD